MKALLSKCLREFRPRWRRALDIVFIPSPAWRRVALEREGVATLFVGYVLPLSMIPALAWSFGLAFVARPGVTSIPLLTAVSRPRERQTLTPGTVVTQSDRGQSAAEFTPACLPR